MMILIITHHIVNCVNVIVLFWIVYGFLGELLETRTSRVAESMFLLSKRANLSYGWLVVVL